VATSTASEGVERLRLLERTARRAGIKLQSFGWDEHIGLHASVADLATLCTLLHYLNEDIGEIKLGGEVSHPRYRTTTMLDSIEFTVYCGA
jgi:hypothetical protein